MLNDQTAEILHWLMDHGEPATASEIAAAIQANPILVRVTLYRNRSLFVPHRRKVGECRRCNVPQSRMFWAAWEE